MSVIRSHVSSLTDSGVSTSSRRGLAACTKSEMVPSFLTAPSSRVFQPSRLERSAGEEVDTVLGRRGGDVAAEHDRALGLQRLGDAAADAAGAAGDQGAFALEKFHAHARHASRTIEGRQYWRRHGWTWRWSSAGWWKRAPRRSGWSWPGWSSRMTDGWTRPGRRSAEDTPLEVRGQLHPYVSRGGLKLEKALDHFAIPVTGRIALDVGSSTGGFTDCLLQRGAVKVYAVDVGTNQLAWKLRTDPRVVSMEKTNIRDVTRAEIPEPIDLVVCDASFVGLRLVLPAALALAAPGAHLAALIKPQFEVGKGRVGKGGIVREPELHDRSRRDDLVLAGRATGLAGARRDGEPDHRRGREQGVLIDAVMICHPERSEGSFASLRMTKRLANRA